MRFLSKKAILIGLSGLMVITVTALLHSCYPGDPITPADTDVITTFYDPAADFASKNTYAMPDSVIQIEDPDKQAADISRQFDQLILDKIEENLESLGYERVLDPEQADVLVLPAVTSTTWLSGGCYYFWSYWYPYPGYCYPVAYTYTTGTVVITMADPDATNKRDALWIAGINGLMSESGAADISARINQNIDQAFYQSPYLGAGK